MKRTFSFIAICGLLLSFIACGRTAGIDSATTSTIVTTEITTVTTSSSTTENLTTLTTITTATTKKATSVLSSTMTKNDITTTTLKKTHIFTKELSLEEALKPDYSRPISDDIGSEYSDGYFYYSSGGCLYRRYVDGVGFGEEEFVLNSPTGMIRVLDNVVYYTLEGKLYSYDMTTQIKRVLIEDFLNVESLEVAGKWIFYVTCQKVGGREKRALYVLRTNGTNHMRIEPKSGTDPTFFAAVLGFNRGYAYCKVIGQTVSEDKVITQFSTGKKIDYRSETFSAVEFRSESTFGGFMLTLDSLIINDRLCHKIVEKAVSLVDASPIPIGSTVVDVPGGPHIESWHGNLSIFNYATYIHDYLEEGVANYHNLRFVDYQGNVKKVRIQPFTWSYCNVKTQDYVILKRQYRTVDRDPNDIYVENEYEYCKVTPEGEMHTFIARIV